MKISLVELEKKSRYYTRVLQRNGYFSLIFSNKILLRSFLTLSTIAYTLPTLTLPAPIQKELPPITTERQARLKRLNDAFNVSTEQVNQDTISIDQKPIEDAIVDLYKAQAAGYTQVAPAIFNIGKLVAAIVPKYQAGGRIFYLGAGTSGRLGVLDASEIPPTYGVDGRFIGIIAGGDKALRHSIEGAEDNPALAAAVLKQHRLSPNDTVIGISANGNAPYVVGALQYAKQIGALTAAITCNPNTKIEQIAEHIILTPTGPEPITGSSRMNAGSAHKLVLNLISTGVMVATGHTYSNAMITMRASNTKLEDRAKKIAAALANTTTQNAQIALQQTAKSPREWDIPAAIVMLTQQSKLASIATTLPLSFWQRWTTSKEKQTQAKQMLAAKQLLKNTPNRLTALLDDPSKLN